MYRNEGKRHSRFHNRGSNQVYDRQRSHCRKPITGFCMFCKSDIMNEYRENHARWQCPIFKELKANTSRISYIASMLKDEDEDGFAAAGILPWRRDETGDIEFLLAREYREPDQNRTGGDRLNFLGGKRLRKETKSINCAVDKVNEETGRKLSLETLEQMRQECPLVCWDEKSKYVLYLFNLVRSDDKDIDFRCAGLPVAGVKRLEWIKRDNLLDEYWVKDQFHEFASDLLQEMVACDVMDSLEDFLDESSLKFDDLSPKMTKKEVIEHFDILGALKSALAIANPNVRFRESPSSLIKHAPLFQNDIEKIKVRIGPDRLQNMFHRDPTQEEISLSTKAMQILEELSKENPSDLELRTFLGEFHVLYTSMKIESEEDTDVE